MNWAIIGQVLACLLSIPSIIFIWALAIEVAPELLNATRKAYRRCCIEVSDVFYIRAWMAWKKQCGYTNSDAKRFLREAIKLDKEEQ